MDVTTATDFMTTNKGAAILVVLTDSATHYGEALSVNSKGVNIKVDGKTRSFALSRVDFLELDNAGDEDLTDEDMEDEDFGADSELEDIVNQIADGATTADIAGHLTDYLKREVTPKELRVHLRALGLGVGKGRKYALSSGEFRAVVRVLTEAVSA